MADRQTDDARPGTVADTWQAATATQRAGVKKQHGPAALDATLAWAGSLRTAQLPPPGD